jgi:hypothetical protein
VAEKELHYRCRLVVEMYDGDDEPQPDSEPFKSVPLADLHFTATACDVEHEVDTDRGVLIEREVEIVEVQHDETVGHGSTRVDFRNRKKAADHPLLQRIVKSLVFQSGESAIEKSEPADADDVFVEADS